jgi:CheY-like chemotaxis protein
MLSPLIMVIDDDESIRLALSEVLQDEGYRVLAVADGREALAYLSADELPELILLDLMMPIFDGWAFRAEQMMNPKLASIPVLIITALPSDRRKADLGVDVVQKPFDTGVLLSLIRHHCSPVAGSVRGAPLRSPDGPVGPPD